MTMRATNIKNPKHVILTQTNKTNTFLSPKFEEKKEKKVWVSLLPFFMLLRLDLFVSVES